MTRPPPRISIVTASFNQGRFIEQAIKSVLEQGYPDFEHIVLDNCSTDGTVEILRRYPHLKWTSEPDEGQSDALNKGFAAATGELVGWLNTDDYYLPGCFSRVAVHHARRPGADVIYGDYRWIDGAGKVLQYRRELGFDLFMLRYLHTLYIPTASTFIRRRVFEDGHFLRCDLVYSMDYDFFLRLALAGYSFSHLPEFLADYRWHDDNKSSTGTGQQIAEFRSIQLQHDPWMRSLPSWSRPPARKLLEITARAKRTALKLARGHLLRQWA